MAGATTTRAPWALLAAVGACLLYACAAEGATDVPAQSWVQLALALLATASVAAWLYGNGLRLRASRAGVAGLAALVAFAAWAAASIAWSVAPDRSWVEANNVIAYAIAVVIGMLLGSSLPRAPERVGLCLSLVLLPIALFALAGKTVPALDVGPLSFDHAAAFSRLRAPLGYWNALALVCVSGLLPLLRVAADPSRRPWPRVAALLGVFVFALVLEMTYSRGGLLALVAGAGVLVALSTERVRTVVLLASALAATAGPLAIALGREALTTDFIPVEAREGAAADLLVAVGIALALLAAWGRALIALERSGGFSPARARAVGRPLAGFAAAAAAVVLVGFFATGAAARTFEDFRDVKAAAGQTDPNRVLSTNSGNRWIWWREAAGAFADRPLAGWGAGSFPVTHRLYRKRPLTVLQPHSVPLQWLAEHGAVGFLLGVGALGALLAAGLARVRALPWATAGAPPDRGATAALFAVAVAWTVQSLVEWSWDIPAVTLPAFLVLGVLAARPDRSPPRPLPARGPALAVTAVASVLVAVSALLPALARTETTAALTDAGRDRATARTLADAAARIELAARLNPLSTDPLLAGATIAARRGRADLARRYLLRAVDRQPYDAKAWSQLAVLAFERGDREGLRRAAARALALDPIDPRARSLAMRASVASSPPDASASATGSPLVTEVAVP